MTSSRPLRLRIINVRQAHGQKGHNRADSDPFQAETDFLLYPGAKLGILTTKPAICGRLPVPVKSHEKSSLVLIVLVLENSGKITELGYDEFGPL